MRRRELLTGLAAGIAFGIESACSRNGPSALRKIRIGAIRRLSTAGLHLAEEMGYFRQAGFDVEILQNGTPQNSIALLAGGKIDCYLGGSTAPVFNAMARGVPMRIVAGMLISSASCRDVGAIFALRRTFPQGLGDLRVLKGKRMGVTLAVGISHFALDAQLRSVGLSIDDVSTVSLDTRQNVAALMGGGVDALVGVDDSERDISELAEVVHTRGISRLYPNLQYAFVMFGKTMLDGGVDQGARFLSAYLRGVREYRAGKTPRFVEEYARASGLDLQRALGACRNSYPRNGEIDLSSLRTLSDWYARRKYLVRPLEVTEMADLRFIERAHEGKG